MPHYNRPGTRYNCVAVRTLLHAAPCVVDNVVGTAQKQKAVGAGAGLTGNVQTTIAIGETFAIVCKGIVQVPYVATAAKGSTVWINATSDALTLTDPGAGNGRKFGRVVEIAGQRGTPTGFMRVDLDLKDTF